MKASLAVLLALVTTSIAAELVPQRMTPTSYVLALFAIDLDNPWTETSPYGIASIPYEEVSSFSKPAQAKLALIVPGLTRTQLLKAGFAENGGPRISEFFLSAPPSQFRTPAIRVALRPAAMPESVYSDPVRRHAWLSEFSPAPTDGDVIMRVSRPFWSRSIAD